MGNYLCVFFRTLWNYFYNFFMDYFANIFRSLLDEVRKKKKERCRTGSASDAHDKTLDESAIEAQESFLTTPLTGQGRSAQTLPLVESDKLEDSRAVGGVSPLTISPPAASAPQEEARLSEVDVNAKKVMITKRDQEEVDEIMDAFRRNDVAWMNRKLEDLKQQGSSKTSTPISLQQEQEDQNSEFIYANLDYEWVDEFEENPPPRTRPPRLREPRSELTNEISRHYTPNAPSFLNASTSTPLSQKVNSLLYKEVGLRPMNPAYYKIAYDCGSDDEPTTSQNLNAHHNPGKSSIKKKIANNRKAKGKKSHRHAYRH